MLNQQSFRSLILSLSLLQLACMYFAFPAQAQKESDPPITINSQIQHATSGGSLTQLINMGQILSGKGDFVEAEKCFKAALEMIESQPVKSRDLLHKAYCLNNLALLYMNQGQLADAETYFKQVVEVSGQIDLSKDPILGIALDNLGQTYRFQKRFDEAEKSYRQALAAEEASVGKANSDYAITQVNLAVLYITEKKFGDAKTLLNEALKTFEITSGKESASYQQTSKYLEVAEKAASANSE